MGHGCIFNIYEFFNTRLKAALRLLRPSVDTEQTKSLVPDTHNSLVPDTQITHWRGTEVLTKPANIT